MKRELFLWQFAGFSLTSFGGTILHFLYDWTGGSMLIAPFSGVNESTWEHMKLLFFPLFLFAVVQSRYFRDIPSFWWGKLAGTLTGLTLIPVLFYTYNGALGPSPDWVNIGIFYVAAAGCFLLEGWLMKKELFWGKGAGIALCILCIIGIFFGVFTFFPLRIPLFCDPITGQYGII
ncbi:MAG: hypothetical protein IJY82_04875 [Oscillospiraceae bacterium]|nr:hypothetical protein [Oscillospiraceae bacterium]